MKYSESNEDLLNEYAQLSGKLMQRYLSEEEQTHLHGMRGELLRRMTAAAETTPPAKPAYEEIVTGLERALEHLDYCGWGDSWEREVSEELRKELPALLERAKA